MHYSPKHETKYNNNKVTPSRVHLKPQINTSTQTKSNTIEEQIENQNSITYQSRKFSTLVQDKEYEA